MLGRIDVLIYNSGAIWWSAVETTPLKRFKLMHEVNAEGILYLLYHFPFLPGRSGQDLLTTPPGLYSTIQSCLPIFKHQNYRARIIVVSPPIYDRFIHGKTAYAMSKLSMSILTLGLAKDISRQNHKDMSITSIWPAVAITSAATELNPAVQEAGMDSVSLEKRKDLRKPEIYSDAILAMLRAPCEKINGRLELDEDYLRTECGYKDEDFEKYNLVPGSRPRRIMPKKFPSLEVEEQNDEGVRMDSVKLRGGRL